MKDGLSARIISSMAKKEPDRELGERIRYLREEVLGMKAQTELADAIGTTRGAVGNWELGQGIKLENLQKITHRYKISFEWLATGNGERPEPRKSVLPALAARDDPESTESVGHRLQLLREKLCPGEGIPYWVATLREPGITANDWIALENGYRRPSDAEILAIIRRTGVTSDWILYNIPGGLTVHLAETLGVRSGAA